MPVYLASRIVGWHNHRVSLEMLCEQARKHGVGCAEAAVKVPAVLENERVSAVLRLMEQVANGTAHFAIRS